MATPFETIYMGLWSYNCVLSCIAIGGMFYALTWQTHLLALVCGGYLGKLTTRSLCNSFLPSLLDYARPMRNINWNLVAVLEGPMAWVPMRDLRFLFCEMESQPCLLFFIDTVL